MWAVARRPRWIAVLLLAIAVAGAFAALGRWQLERAVEQGTAEERDTETPVALEQVAEPQAPLLTEAGGRRVEVTGTWVPADTEVLEGRVNDGVEGAWLVGHFVDGASGGSLAVALGWAPTAEQAADATDAPLPSALVGRYLPSEAPQEVDFEGGVLTMSVARLVNDWSTEGIYAGYLVLDEPPAGLAAIESSAPVEATALNWLNVFYAAEWVVFAGFAVYMWYRLVKDAWEREEYDRLEAAGAAGGAGPGAAPRIH